MLKPPKDPTGIRLLDATEQLASIYHPKIN